MKKIKANGKELMLIPAGNQMLESHEIYDGEFKLIGKLSELNYELGKYVDKPYGVFYRNYINSLSFRKEYSYMQIKDSFLSLLNSQGIELEHENYLLIEIL